MNRKGCWLSVVASISLVIFASCATVRSGGEGGGIAARAANAALGGALDDTMGNILGDAMVAAESAIAIAGVDASARENLLAIANAAALESATDALSAAVEEARDAAMAAASGIAGQAALGAAGGFVGGGRGGAATSALDAAQSAARSAVDGILAAASISAADVARDAALNAIDAALGGTGTAALLPPAAQPLPAIALHSDLDTAISNSSSTLSSGMRSAPRVAVLTMSTASDRMSDFIIDEKNLALSVGGSLVVSRSQIDLLAEQLNFSTAEQISNLMKQLVGRQLDVQYVITGTFEPFADFFRFRTLVTEVETAAIRGVHTANVLNDGLVTYLMGAGAPVIALATPVTPIAPPTAPVTPIAPAAPAMTHNLFTSGQRWGTFWLNWLIPGLGSFAIMGDTFGGIFQLACSGTGLALFALGVRGREVSDSWQDGDGQWHSYSYRESRGGFILAGGLLLTTSLAVNIVRSSRFGRNVQTAYSSTDWNIALTPVPGPNGVNGASLFYTRRF